MVQEASVATAERFASAEVRIAEREASLTAMKRMAQEAKTEQKVDGLRRLLANIPDRVNTMEADSAASAVSLQLLHRLAVELEDRTQTYTRRYQRVQVAD